MLEDNTLTLSFEKELTAPDKMRSQKKSILVVTPKDRTNVVSTTAGESDSAEREAGS